MTTARSSLMANTLMLGGLMLGGCTHSSSLPPPVSMSAPRSGPAIGNLNQSVPQPGLPANRVLHGQNPWKPTVAGRRFTRLVVYSRHDCHLCDDAKAILADYVEYLPRIEEVDIDSDPELRSRFGEVRGFSTWV